MSGSSSVDGPRLVLARRLIEGGQFEAAVQAINAHDADYPSDPRATILRAEISLLRRDLNAAETAFTEVCNSGGADAAMFANARAGRGAALYALGDIGPAVDELETAIEGGERTARAWLTLAQSLFALGRSDDLAALCDRGRSIGNLDLVTVRAVTLISAIDAYARDQIDQACRFLTTASEEDVTEESTQLGLETYRRLIEAGLGGRGLPDRRSLTAALGYQDYLEKLIQYRAANPALYGNRSLASLHVIGDSHTLSPAHTRVALDAEDYRVVPHPVIGAKAWHLATGINPAATPQRNAFERLVTLLPRGEPAIAMFGEIDCRAREGLFPFLKSRPEHDPDQHCRALAGSYVEYISASLAANERRIMICGVPAPHPIQAHKLGDDSRRFVDLVRLFNTRLGDATREAGLVFLDPHQLTDADDGVASGDLHLDTIHLKPDFFQTLLAASSGRAI